MEPSRRSGTFPFFGFSTPVEPEDEPTVGSVEKGQGLGSTPPPFWERRTVPGSIPSLPLEGRSRGFPPQRTWGEGRKGDIHKNHPG